MTGPMKRRKLVADFRSELDTAKRQIDIERGGKYQLEQKIKELESKLYNADSTIKHLHGIVDWLQRQVDRLQVDSRTLVIDSIAEIFDPTRQTSSHFEGVADLASCSHDVRAALRLLVQALKENPK